MSEQNLIKAARRASGLTMEQAAQIVGVSYPTYFEREKNPESFKVEELQKLYGGLNEYSQHLLNEYKQNFFTL